MIESICRVNLDFHCTIVRKGKTNGRIQRGQGRTLSGKSKVGIETEKCWYRTPIASWGRILQPSVKYVDD